MLSSGYHFFFRTWEVPPSNVGSNTGCRYAVSCGFPQLLWCSDNIVCGHCDDAGVKKVRGWIQRRLVEVGVTQPQKRGVANAAFGTNV